MYHFSLPLVLDTRMFRLASSSCSSILSFSFELVVCQSFFIYIEHFFLNLAGWLYRNLHEKVDKLVVSEPRCNKFISSEGD